MGKGLVILVVASRIIRRGDEKTMKTAENSAKSLGYDSSCFYWLNPTTMGISSFM